MNNQFLQGKLTYLSLAVAAVAAVFQLFHKPFPKEEAEQVVGLIQVNWETIVQICALVTAAFGRARREWREDKAASDAEEALVGSVDLDAEERSNDGE